MIDLNNNLSENELKAHIWFNGNFIFWQEAKIHVLNHSLHYGGSVFEGIKAVNGKIFKAEEHFSRLLSSAKLMRYEANYVINDLIEATYKLINLNNLPNAYIRPLIWRNTDNTILSPINPKTNIMIAAWKPLAKLNSYDLKLNISKWIKAGEEIMPVQCKSSCHYSMMIIAITEAKEQGFNDSILLDKQNNIAECTTSNIFFYENSNLYTPTTKNCLNGITRQSVINIAKKIGYNIFEQEIKPSDLDKFSGAFITGTAAGIKFVKEITDNEKVFIFNNKKIFDSVSNEYQNQLNE